MKKNLLIIILLLVTLQLSAFNKNPKDNEENKCNANGYTAIPDTNFEATLETLGYDDISSDGQVPTALIETITNLNISNSGISDLTGIEAFVSLERLTVNDNNLTSIDVSNLPNLERLLIYGNQMTSLDLSNNPNLKRLFANNNQITSIDLSNNPLISSLRLGNNLLTAIDVSSQINLTSFQIENNALSEIDLSSNPLMWQLFLNDNNLTEIDLTSNTALVIVQLQNNNLEALNIQNGNNETLIVSFNATSNPNLTCIRVDNASYATTNWTTIDTQTFFSSTYCVYTTIPDANFESALEALGYDDISADGQVPTTLIENVTNLNVDNKGISDLTGIEDFTALFELFCRYNSLTSLDFSSNLSLARLICDDNMLSSINLSNNTQLTHVLCYKNQLASLDISASAVLNDINISENPITSITLPDTSTLEYFYAEETELITLDLSGQIVIEEIVLSGPDLTFINLQNANNTFINEFYTIDSPSLSCILVDDAVYSTTNWTDIDVTTSFSDTYCRYTAIPDSNFEAALEALGYDDISSDGQVPTALIELITHLNVNNKNISDLTGIEDFTALYVLFCEDNNITSIDISANPALVGLLCANNQVLNNITIGENSQLGALYCNQNQISNLDLSNCSSLEELNISDNPITEIDLSSCLDLEVLYAENTNLISLDLSTNVNFFDLIISSHQLTYLNVQNGNNTSVDEFYTTGSPNLSCILVDDVVYSTTNWTNIDSTTSFSDTNCVVDYEISIKVYLQGALLNPNTGENNLMRDNLRVLGMLPTTAPYADGMACNSSVFNDGGTSGTGAVNDNIVDWIWVELRDEIDNTTVIASQSALLQRDGDIVGVDGISSLTFSIETPEVLVVIKHRNHLGMMTSNVIVLNEMAPIILDFTDANNQITYGTNAQTTSGIPSGIVAMWAGNVNGDNQVRYQGSGNDTNTIKDNVLAEAGNTSSSNLYLFSDYNTGDVNMDANIRYQGSGNDSNTIKDIILGHPGNTSNSNLYVIEAQLPENN